MSNTFTESVIEQAAFAGLERQGYQHDDGFIGGDLLTTMRYL